MHCHRMPVTECPKSVHTAGFVDTCLEVFATTAPVNRWLQTHVVGP